MTGVGTILALSLLVQFVVERVKVIKMSDNVRQYAVPVIALGVSITLTLSCKIGLLAVFNIGVEPPMVDYLLTGVIISGGSTLVNELIKAMQGLKETLQQNT